MGGCGKETEAAEVLVSLSYKYLDRLLPYHLDYDNLLSWPLITFIVLPLVNIVFSFQISVFILKWHQERLWNSHHTSPLVLCSTMRSNKHKQSINNMSAPIGMAIVNQKMARYLPQTIWIVTWSAHGQFWSLGGSHGEPMLVLAMYFSTKYTSKTWVQLVYLKYKNTAGCTILGR